MGELRHLWIPGPAGNLQAALRVACPARAAAVVAHPHPLHGGTLDNPVVFHTDRELHRAGFTTLRFNFRGVGSSEGVHDEGRGEVGDVAAAVSWLRGVALNVPMICVGYSFGSWCSLRHAIGDRSVRGMVAVGLPIRHFAFEELKQFDRPFGVVQGSEDEFGSPEEILDELADLSPKGTLHLIEGAPHLFPGQARDAASAVVLAATEMLGELADEQ